MSFSKKIGFFLIICLTLVDIRCASSALSTSKTKASRSAHNRRVQGDRGKESSVLVGVWQGFWSLKGRVETDRFLFLDDGRWGWLATVKSDESGRYSLIQRSGRWEAREGVVELTELQRKEILGCKERSWPVRSCETSGDCEGCDGGYRIVHHDRPLVERISIGECPQNREAERLDNQYTCLSIGGRIFWRKAVPEKREQDRFIYGR